VISRRVISFLVPGVSLLGPPLPPPPPPPLALDQRPAVGGTDRERVQVFI
jgi:hypothetical protein